MKLKDLLSRWREEREKRDREVNYTCELCRREVFENERLCADCTKELSFSKSPVCPFCGRTGREEGTCAACKERPLKVEKARSALVYEGQTVSLVYRFKRGQKYLKYLFAGLLLPVLQREFAAYDLIVGVPMTEKSFRERGYNQSFLLAEELSFLSGVPYAVVARKTKETDSQKELGRNAREKNLAGCFHIDDRQAVKGKRVLIVDDVMTTGSTGSEYGDALKRAGAEKAGLLTVAAVPAKDFSKRV